MSMLSQRTYEISDPAMAPIFRLIESYVVWTDLPTDTRHDLLLRAHAGDKAAVEAVMFHNLRLVLSCAMKKVGHGLPLNDLMQEGCIGLQVAVRRYDPLRPRKGSQFASMAVWWIRRAIRDAVIKEGRAIRLPHYVYEQLTNISVRLAQGKPILVEEKQFLEDLEPFLQRPASLDRPSGEYNQEPRYTHEASTLASFLPAAADDDPTDRIYLEQLLLEMVNTGVLSRREGWLIVRYHGMDGDGGRTYTEMAEELHAAGVRLGLSTPATRPLTRERIRQLMAGAMTKVRKYVYAQPGTSSDWQAGEVYLREQAKGSDDASLTRKVKASRTPEPKQRTSSDDSPNRKIAASPSATPTPFLRVHGSTKRAKRSSGEVHEQDAALHVSYQKAI